jgi:flagellar basal body P-ring formation protein FlgA
MADRRTFPLLLSILSGLAIALSATGSLGEGVVAARTIRAHSILSESDLTLSADAVPGAAETLDLVLDREARVAIFAGQPVRLSDLSDPALIERNQIVPVVFRRGGLEIRAEARALGRAAAGEPLRAMNTASRTIISGHVAPDGSLSVSDAP